MISIIVPQQLALAKLARGTTFNKCMLAGMGVEASTKQSNLVFNQIVHQRTNYDYLPST